MWHKEKRQAKAQHVYIDAKNRVKNLSQNNRRLSLP